MSKAVLISIRSEWCELIASDEKTIEIRKTKPNLYVPIKVYIYCTKANVGTDKLWILDRRIRPEYNGLSAVCANLENPSDSMLGNGKVIGEFVCNNIYEIEPGHAIETFISEESCVSPRQMHEYLKGRTGYGWSISDLKIYDTPRDLREFTGLRQTKFGAEPVPITRPPQSWCYVEEM